MVCRHVLCSGSRPAREAAPVTGHPLAQVVDLNDVDGVSDLNLLADQPMRHAVVVPLELDVVVDPNSGFLPDAVVVGLGRKSPHRREIIPLEDLSPVACQLLEGSAVDRLQTFLQGLIELVQAVEDLIARGGQDLAFSDQDTGLRLRLVAGPSATSREHGDAEVLRHFVVGRVDLGLVEFRLGYAALQVVRDENPGAGPEVSEHVGVSPDPMGQGLGRAGLDVGVVAGPHHSDEDLSAGDPASLGVDDRYRVAGEVHEALLPELVDLAHDRFDAGQPLVVFLAEPTVFVAVGMGLPVFLPRERPGNVIVPSAQLPMYGLPVWNGTEVGLGHLQSVEPGLELSVVKRRVERPYEPGGAKSRQGVADSGWRHLARHPDLPVRPVQLEPQPQYFSDISHRHSQGWHALAPLHRRWREIRREFAYNSLVADRLRVETAIGFPWKS